MMGVVKAFENTPHTLGREGTVFFLLEYLNYLNQVNAELENTERWLFSSCCDIISLLETF